jgi:hypothetical protein
MKRLVALASILTSLLAGAPPVFAAELQRADFRYQRTLAARGGGPVVFEPDGPLFAHSLGGFADLRVLDARGEQVAWRRVPTRRGSKPQRVPVLDSGRRGRHAVALLDLGAQRRVRDRVVLDIPERGFVGRAVVLGADRRQGPFTRLSTTGIYDIRGGAQPARSTVAVFPPSDFRYLQLRASGVRRIRGATVSGAGERPRVLRREPRSVSRREQGSRSIITLDFGFRQLPVDELQIEAVSPRYERPVEVLGSDDRRHFVPLAGARIFRFAGSRSAPIAVGAHHRYLRIEIENGDDAPLSGIRITARSRARSLLVEGNRPRPYTLLYGNPGDGAPSYDFARLPVRALGLDHAVSGRLGTERSNPAYEPPPDTRSFAARHPGTVVAALALAALALGAVGLLALRSRVE